MTKKSVVEHKSVVVENLFCQCDLVGVHVELRNAEVTEVMLTWYEKSASSSGWVQRLLPGGEEWLKDLHVAIADVLDQVAHRKGRQALLYRIGAATQEEAVAEKMQADSDLGDSV